MVASTNWAAGAVTVEVPHLQAPVTAVVPSVLEQMVGVVTTLGVPVAQYLVAASQSFGMPPTQSQGMEQKRSDEQAPRRLDGAAEVTATRATNTQRVAFICQACTNSAWANQASNSTQAHYSRLCMPRTETT